MDRNIKELCIKRFSLLLTICLLFAAISNADSNVLLIGVSTVFQNEPLSSRFEQQMPAIMHPITIFSDKANRIVLSETRPKELVFKIEPTWLQKTEAMIKAQKMVVVIIMFNKKELVDNESLDGHTGGDLRAALPDIEPDFANHVYSGSIDFAIVSFPLKQVKNSAGSSGSAGSSNSGGSGGSGGSGYSEKKKRPPLSLILPSQKQQKKNEF